MVKILEEFPRFMPRSISFRLLAEQIEEYASGHFKEPWFEIAFAPADSPRDQAEARCAGARLSSQRELRASLAPVCGACSHELRAGRRGGLRWRTGACASGAICKFFRSSPGWTRSISPRIPWSAAFREGQGFHGRRQGAAARQAARTASRRATGIPPGRGARTNRNFDDAVSITRSCRCSAIPISLGYPIRIRPCLSRRFDTRGCPRAAPCARGSTTRNVFGQPPAGFWPSEGSVSDQALEIAAELGFRWFATDEGVLGAHEISDSGATRPAIRRTVRSFTRRGRFSAGKRSMVGFFRDHYLSDLVGFVYSRMSAEAAADDLHRRIRAIGDREPQGRTATVSVILDGENAWEYYPGNGREFLRQFYRAHLE